MKKHLHIHINFLICVFALNLFVTLGFGQNIELNEARWVEILTEEKPADVKVTSMLYHLARLQQEDSVELQFRSLQTRLLYDEQRRAYNIEIVYRDEQNANNENITDRIDLNYLASLGFKIDGYWKNRASAWIRPDEIIPLARKLYKDYTIMEVHIQEGDNEGPGLMNSNTYVNGTFRGGAGRTIAIIDSEFQNLQTRINNNQFRVPNYVWNNGAVTNVAGVNTGGTHGTSCAEIAFDHAPNATYEIYRATNTTQRAAAIDRCVERGVDIISMSMSSYNVGWADNTGAVCVAANTAVDNNNMLIFTSCGNRARSHYQSTWSDPNNNSLHNFTANDERNGNLRNVPASGNNNNNVHFYLSWNPVSGSDYDLEIVRNSDGVVLASSTNTGNTNYEYAEWTNNTANAVAVSCRVRRKNSATASPEFEMFTHNRGDYQYRTEASSNTSPSNSTRNNVISVGAVTRNSYNNANTANVIANYSSQGPTNSGNLAPKMSAPTDCTTGAGSFGGTSCATPNAAGMAAAFWSAHTYLDARGVQQIIRRKARLYRDWGDAATDNVYGSGGGMLYPWASGQRYMYRINENSAVTDQTRPYFNLQLAQQLAPNNTTVIMLSTTFPESGLYGNVANTGLGKRITYVSLAGRTSFSSWLGIE